MGGIGCVYFRSNHTDSYLELLIFQPLYHGANYLQYLGVLKYKVRCNIIVDVTAIQMSRKTGSWPGYAPDL